MIFHNQLELHQKLDYPMKYFHNQKILKIKNGKIKNKMKLYKLINCVYPVQILNTCKMI